MHIRNPLEWGVDQVKLAGSAIEAMGGRTRPRGQPLPVRRIPVAALRYALARGLDDFAAARTDVVFLCVVYPVVGLVLSRLLFGYDLLPVIFPLASGFALIGPIAAVGLYEMSRRREAGAEVSWADAFGVLRAPSLGRLALFGLMLMVIFLVWLNVAVVIYDLTLGPQPPASLAAFISDLFATAAGWTMIGAGIGIGFLFAALVLAISVVSVPLLLDRSVTLAAAIGTSLNAVATNPGPMSLWGLVVAAGLVLGSMPLFLGLIVVMPVLGHATWHLYRQVVVTE